MLESYLKDYEFLRELDLENIKILTTRITILNWDETPIVDYTGRVLPGGTLNLDGTSCLRRTCNINLLLEDDEINIMKLQNIISINKKIKLEIGVNNTLSNKVSFRKYMRKSTIWFPLGTYLITQSNINRSTSGTTVSLQLKDKMCLLNGELGGTLPASITFSEMGWVDDDGYERIDQPTLYQIILELVNHWGNEPLENIIISDLDIIVKKVMKWNNPNTDIWIRETREQEGISSYQYRTEPPTESLDEWERKTYGEDIGFIYTDFIWPGEDLTSGIGESVTSVLDKISSALGNFEYFYDVEGKFHFREKKNYLNTTQAKLFIDQLSKRAEKSMINDYLTLVRKEDYQMDMSRGKAEYVIDDDFLITSYGNTPQFNMIKNDFLCWGMRKIADGTTLPIRYHLAIDKKPELNLHLIILFTDTDGFKKAQKVYFLEDVENDDYKIGRYYCSAKSKIKVVADHFVLPKKIKNRSSIPKRNGEKNKKFEVDVKFRDDLTPEGRDDQVYLHQKELILTSEGEGTHINNYVIANNYSDLRFDATPQYEIFTRLYNNDPSFRVYVDFEVIGGITYYDNDIFRYDYDTDENGNKIKTLIPIKKENSVQKRDAVLALISSKDWRTELYLQGIEAEPLALDKNFYYTELINEWPKIYDIEHGKFQDSVLKDPTSMDYFLDFIDADTAIGEFSIDNIGRRTKAETDEKVNCIFSSNLPDCVIIEQPPESATEEEQDEYYEELQQLYTRSGQDWATVSPDLYSNLVQGGILNSAYNKVREWLYQYTSYCENITIQCIPIYHLDVNTRITVEDSKSGINGDYIINRITLPLDCNGMMSINATKAIERI